MKDEKVDGENTAIQWMSLPLYAKLKEAAEAQSFKKLEYAIDYYISQMGFITSASQVRFDRSSYGMFKFLICGRNVTMELEKRIKKSIRHARKAAPDFTKIMEIKICSGNTFKKIIDQGVFSTKRVHAVIFLTSLPQCPHESEKELKFFHELIKFCSNRKEPLLVMIAATGFENSVYDLIGLFNVFVVRCTLEEFLISDKRDKLQLWNLHWKHNDFQNMLSLLRSTFVSLD